LQSKVTQITNKEKIIFGRDHNLLEWGYQPLYIRHGGRNSKAGYSDSRDCRKSRYSKADSGFFNIDCTATRKIIRSVRHCMHICDVEYNDRLQRLTA
jgi:hypothetical protein